MGSRGIDRRMPTQRCCTMTAMAHCVVYWQRNSIAMQFRHNACCGMMNVAGMPQMSHTVLRHRPSSQVWTIVGHSGVIGLSGLPGLAPIIAREASYGVSIKRHFKICWIETHGCRSIRLLPIGRTLCIIANRKAVVRPNRSIPLRASRAPIIRHLSGKAVPELP
jgi:hypothetical protein